MAERLFFPQINVDEAELCSISGQVNRAVQIELSHDAVTVVFNCFGADEKFICSLDYRPPAPEGIMPLHFDPFWLSSSQENIAQILT